MTLESFLRELLDTVLSSVFDPHPVTFKERDEDGVRPVSQACSNDRMVYELRKPLNRSSFLCGCLDFTENEPIEHLIAGFGYRHGSTTKVHTIVHVEGEPDHVDIPDNLVREIESYLATSYRAEVLVFHNHPRNLINAIFDSVPLPSTIDRRLVLDAHFRPLLALKALMGGGTIKFYLGENGYVQQFRTPALLELLEIIVQKGQRP